MPLPLPTGYLPELALRATVLLGGALLLARALRGASAASRHAYWTITTIALLLLPFLQARLPIIPLEWLSSPRLVEQPAIDVVDDATGAATFGATVLVDRGTIAAPPASAPPRPARRGSLLLVLWLAGLAGFAVPIAIGIRRARRLVSRADHCHDGRVLARFVAICHEVGLRRHVRLLLSDEARTPMTGGIARPVVLLPRAATGWSDDCLDAVLRHELVHVRRFDSVRQLASRWSVACYWFHPLAWRVARCGALAREQACDEAVLAFGTRPSRYARHLLELAEPGGPGVLVPALVRLDHPHLEERVMAILQVSDKPASRRRSILVSLGVLAWSVAVVAVGPAHAQVPAPPAPPEAPAPPLEVPAPPAPPADRAVLAVMAPTPPAPPSADMAPLPPLPPPAPLAPVIGSVDGRVDCEQVGGGYRTGSDRSGPVRMMSTTMDDDLRVCVAVRGAYRDGDEFPPTGTLRDGLVVTMATSGPSGSQRLEIVGNGRANEQHWFVDGRERPFDASAAEWRDALVAFVRTSSEKSKIRGQEAELRGEIARARGDEARMRGEVASIRGRDAAYAGRIASAQAAGTADRMAVAQARVAEASVRQAEAESRRVVRQRDAEMARQVRAAERDAERAEVVAGSGSNADAVSARARVAELRSRQAEEVASVRAESAARASAMRESADRVRSEAAARTADAVARTNQRVVEARAARDAYRADERVAEVEARIRGAGVAGRVAESERKIDALEVDRRIAEIDARLEPLGARLRKAIDRVSPR